MARGMLRAYLCSKGTCSLMGMDLAAWAAEKERPVLILPGSWLLDPESAPEGFRRIAREDRELFGRQAGRKLSFPIMFEEHPAPAVDRIVGPEQWLEFNRQ